MAATAQTILGQPAKRRQPRVTQEMRDRLKMEELRIKRNPELNTPAAPLNVDEKYVFRTYPRTVRGLVHYIDVRPEGLDETEAKNRHTLKRWDFNHRKEAPEYRALVQRVYEENGGPHLEFRKLGRQFECFYATDSKDMADYLRHQMKIAPLRNTEFMHVYEQSPRSRYVVGDQAFPNTEMGLKAARKHMSEIGVTTLEIVEDEE